MALIEYAQKQIPEAEVSEVQTPDCDQVLPVLQFDLGDGGIKYLGITRELWDRTIDFAQLRRHMERAHWQEVLRSAAAKPLTLGQHGWLRSEWKIG